MKCTKCGGTDITLARRITATEYIHLIDSVPVSTNVLPDATIEGSKCVVTCLCENKECEHQWNTEIEFVKPE